MVGGEDDGDGGGGGGGGDGAEPGGGGGGDPEDRSTDSSGVPCGHTLAPQLVQALSWTSPPHAGHVAIALPLTAGL